MSQRKFVGQAEPSCMRSSRIRPAFKLETGNHQEGNEMTEPQIEGE